MVAHGAHLGSLLADNDMAAVGTLPDGVAVAREDDVLLDVVQQLQVTLLVQFLDGSNALHLIGNLIKTFFAGLLGHTLVHVGPLEVLTCSSVLQILDGALNATTLQQFEPQFSVLLLLIGGLLKDSSDLHIAILLSLRCVVGVLVSSL